MKTKFTSLVCILFIAQLSIANPPPDLFLLKTYQNNQDITNWVMSEKLDGVRGFWDGKRLITRSGKTLNPPEWFIQNYPPFAIDGELWTQRNDFEQISSIVRRKIPDERWKKVTHQIFEVPNQSGGLFERLSILHNYLAQNPSQFIKIINQIPIHSKQQVNDYLDVITRVKGEGLVLRDPKIEYKTGRLSSALKAKKHYDDECRVVEILTGRGKYINKMGALKCQLKNGNIVKIGSGFNDNQRSNPPLINTQITFKYYGLTKNGKHKFPIFLRIVPN